MNEVTKCNWNVAMFESRVFSAQYCFVLKFSTRIPSLGRGTFTLRRTFPTRLQANNDVNLCPLVSYPVICFPFINHFLSYFSKCHYGRYF